MTAPLFKLGATAASRGAAAALRRLDLDPNDLLYRHVTGDWGEVPAEDAAENHLAVEAGDLRIMSSYQHGEMRFWVITEADRSSTTILLPEEY